MMNTLPALHPTVQQTFSHFDEECSSVPRYGETRLAPALEGPVSGREGGSSPSKVLEISCKFFEGNIEVKYFLISV